MAAFGSHEHIKRRADFEAVYAGGAKVSGRLMTMFVKRSGDGHARLGIAATRKIGGAVIRNRAKRLTRELFRHHKPDLPLDIVIVPRREFVDARYDTLEHEFDALLARASRPGAPERRHAAAGAKNRRPGRTRAHQGL